MLIDHFFRWYPIYRHFTLIISFRNYYMSTLFSCIHRFCLQTFAYRFCSSARTDCLISVIHLTTLRTHPYHSRRYVAFHSLYLILCNPALYLYLIKFRLSGFYKQCNNICKYSKQKSEHIPCCWIIVLFSHFFPTYKGPKNPCYHIYNSAKRKFFPPNKDFNQNLA